MQTGGDAHNPLDPTEEGTDRMVDEGGPAVPGHVVGPDRVAREQWEYYDEGAVREHTAFTLIQGVYFIFGLVEALIAIRVALRLLGANPQNAFASFLYGVTAPLVQPFAGFSPPPPAMATPSSCTASWHWPSTRSSRT